MKINVVSEGPITNLSILIILLNLQNGASLETKEEYNITPIFTAAQFGQADCLSYMLEHAKETSKLIVMLDMFYF